MKKDKKRKAALAAKAKAESLKFQIQWEAKKFFPEMTPELKMRLAFETAVFLKLGIIDSMLQLKDTIADVRNNLNIDLAYKDTPLCASLLAYIFGIIPENPMEKGLEFDETKLEFPHIFIYKHTDDIRNQIVDYLKSKGYRMTLYIGQPFLVMPSFRLEFRRKVNND